MLFERARCSNSPYDSFRVETVNDKAIVFLTWNTIEPAAQQQILNTASMPFVFKHVAVMPDCHYGKGATVGTVLATQGAVILAAVGVDIGCGMIAVRTPLTRTDIAVPSAIRAGIDRLIPMSAGKNNSKNHGHCRRTRPPARGPSQRHPQRKAARRCSQEAVLAKPVDVDNLLHVLSEIETST
jgi:hypothetical protein